MYCGLKNVYFLFFVRKPRSRARLKSDIALFRKPACLASSRDMRVKISATGCTSSVQCTSIQLAENFHTISNGAIPEDSGPVIWGVIRAALHDSTLLTGLAKLIWQHKEEQELFHANATYPAKYPHDSNVQEDL